MVLSTFNHIAVDKQTRVRNALLHEFVEHPLAEAQVARIVQEAEIARGAFYKYFTDLTDAYNYTFAFVMGAVHQASRNLRGVVRPTTTLSRFDASLMRLINRGFANSWPCTTSTTRAWLVLSRLQFSSVQTDRGDGPWRFCATKRYVMSFLIGHTRTNA